MNEKEAIEILGGRIHQDGGLFDGGSYLSWSVGDAEATLDSTFTADELEAIAWWMRKGNSTPKDET